MCKGTTCNCHEPARTRQEWADDLLAPNSRHSIFDRYDGKLKELEERIRQLEARPYPIVQPYLVPSWPPAPAYPYYPYPVWYSFVQTA